MHDTRCGVIFRHVNQALKHVGQVTQDSFAADVAELYHARTASHLRGVQFHEAARSADIYQTQRLNAQLLFRMLNPTGPTRMPCELEEAVVLSLPQPFRNECLRELSNRLGLLAVPMPCPTPGALVTLGEFVGAFGECVVELSQTIADGHLDPHDAGNSARAVKELDALIAQATSLRAAHQRHADQHVVAVAP
jgi:hypothetical protein